MPYFETRKQAYVHCATYGKEGCPPLILLHGLASRIRIWEPQIAELRRECRIYAFNYPGYGKSELKGTFSYTAFSEILREFMNPVGVEKPIY